MKTVDGSPQLRHVEHTFPPVVNAECRVLLLGSVPSVRSMQAGFYYMHPQNRFWRVLEELLHEPFPSLSVAGRTERLLLHHVALYDSVFACDIVGSSDSKVKNIVPADIPGLLHGTKITRIFCNGARSYAELMRAHPSLAERTTALPSTSPANAAFSLERLTDAWRVILEALT